jgi:hypothetical protein
MVSAFSRNTLLSGPMKIGMVLQRGAWSNRVPSRLGDTHAPRGDIVGLSLVGERRG